MWNPYSQRCERQTGLGLVSAEMLYVDGGGYGYGYYEPYYEPVYYEPVYEPPPVPIAEPVYVAPAPPAYDTGLYLQPGQSYEPAPIEPTSDFWSGEISTGKKVVTPEWPAEPDWPVTPAPEPVFSKPVKMMAEDFYIDDYGGGYYDGGGGYYDYGAGLDTGLYLQPGQSYEPIDYAPYEPMPLEPPVFEPIPIEYEYFGLPYVPEEIPFAPYEPVPLEPPIFEPVPDLFLDYLDYYLGQRYDEDTAVALAEQGAASGLPAPIDIGSEVMLPPSGPPVLPNLPPYTPIPYVTPYTPFETPPYIPPFEPIPPAPPAQQLPGYCPAGTYHPINDPFACVPFPPAPAPAPAPQQPQTQTPRPPAPAPAPQAPRPPTQQQQQTCPTGYCKHPQTGQCMPIPVGYVRHPQTQVCTAQTPQAPPLPIPSEVEDTFADLKKLPWWVWVGLAGVVLLTGGRR